MTSIVRKLISASHGIPPSIVAWDRFWEGLYQQVETWAGAVFPEAENVAVKDRWVEGGEMAIDQFGKHMISVSNSSSGLCVVAMSDQCARTYAASRLGEDLAAMKTVSGLLLRLVCEEPLNELRAEISSAFSAMETHFCESLGSAPSLAPGGFSAEASYLIVAFELSIKGVATTIKIVFELDALRKFSGAAQGKEVSKSSGADASVQDKLRKTVLASNVDVLGIIGRREVSLGDCVRMQPGDVIELPELSGSDLALAIETFDGSHDLAEAELGAWKNTRALKLKRAIDPSFLTGLVVNTANTTVSREEGRL